MEVISGKKWPSLCVGRGMRQGRAQLWNLDQNAHLWMHAHTSTHAHIYADVYTYYICMYAHTHPPYTLLFAHVCNYTCTLTQVGVYIKKYMTFHCFTACFFNLKTMTHLHMLTQLYKVANISLMG